MALQRQPQVTGLGDLGSVLLDTSRAYAATKRQDQLLAQHRAQQLQDVTERRGQQLQDVAAQRSYQLQDVDSQRGYQDKVRREDRAGRLEDVKTEMALRSRATLIAIFQNERLLAPGQENDDQAIATAYAQFVERGLEKLYEELRTTPGPDGAPLLTQEGLLDPAKVQVAKDALGKIKAGLLQEDITAKQRTRTGGQAAADRALVDNQKLESKINALESAVGTPFPQPTADEVNRRARELWLRNNPGKTSAPTDPAKLTVELDAARTELQTARFMAQKERDEGVRRQIELLKAQQIAQSRETGDLGRQGFFANPSTAAAAPVSGLGVRGGFQALSKPSGADDFRNFVTRQAPTAPPPTGPQASSTLANPTDNPVIARANEAMAGQQKARAQATLNDIIRENQQIDATILTASQPLNLPPMGGLGGGIMPSRPPDPVAAGQWVSNLLKRKAMNEARQREVEAMMQGPSVMPPAINTATSSTPAISFGAVGGMAPQTTDWWKTAPGR